MVLLPYYVMRLMPGMSSGSEEVAPRAADGGGGSCMMYGPQSSCSALLALQSCVVRCRVRMRGYIR